MEYAADEGADWRTAIDRWLAKELGHTAFNPNRESKRYVAKHVHAKNFRVLKTRNIVQYTRILRGIVRLDSSEVADRADYVICLWDESAQRGAGTKGEITLAAYFGKPVYLVTEMRLSEIPGWVLGCSTEFFQSFDELKRFLRRRFKQGGNDST
jgi:hypothetical protein